MRFTHERYSPPQLSSMLPWEKDKMVDAPHRSHPCGLQMVALPVPATTWLSPDKDKVTGTHHRTLPVPTPKLAENNNRQTPESQTVCVTPRHCFGHWTQFCAAASSTDPATLDCSTQLHSFWLSSDLAGLRLTSATLFPAAASHTSTAFQHCMPGSSLRRTGRGWAAKDGVGRGRADPDNLPDGEKEAKKLHVQGCSPFLPPETTPAEMLWVV